MEIFYVFDDSVNVDCFSTRQNAIDYVIATRFRCSTWPREELETMADGYVRACRLDEKLGK